MDKEAASIYGIRLGNIAKFLLNYLSIIVYYKPIRNENTHLSIVNRTKL